MKILCLENSDFFYNDIINAFDSLDNEIGIIPLPPISEKDQDSYLTWLEELCGSFHPDFIFSIDYCPFISLFCNLSNIPYLCWIISPYSHDFFDNSVMLGTTHCFCVDSILTTELRNLGVSNITHLPFGVPSGIIEIEGIEQSADINLWGNINSKSFYTDEYKKYSSALLDSTEGYLEGSLACKYQLSYTDFSNAKLPDYILSDLLSSSTYKDCNSVESKKHFIIHNHLNNLLTSIDRKLNLGTFIFQDAYKSINHFNYGNDCFDEKKVMTITNHYCDHSILSAFHSSKINIVIPNRNRQASISPVIWYMMWTGAFFLTHKKVEFDILPECKELLFDDYISMLSKSAYYSSHDSERDEIVKRIRKEVSNNHTISQRLDNMIKTIF